MRIPYTPGFCDLLGEEAYSIERNAILNCSSSLSISPAPLPSLLSMWLADRPFREEQDYFNLKHWIEVLNKLDEILESIIIALQHQSLTEKDYDLPNAQLPDAVMKPSMSILVPATGVILHWTSRFLRCSFNKSVYSSVDRLYNFLNSGFEELSILALEVLAALVVSPPNHLNVYVYNHGTILHEDDAYMEPLFSILRAWKGSHAFPSLREAVETSRSKSFNEDTSNRLFPLQSYTSLSTLFDEMGLLVKNFRQEGEWWETFFSPRPGAGLRQHSVVLLCFLIVIITVPRTDELSDFFQETASLQRDLLYILQNLHLLQQDSELSSIGCLGLDCLKHLAFRSEGLYSDEDSDNYNRAKLIAPFDTILQVQLGIDYSKETSTMLLPRMLHEELQWFTNLIIHAAPHDDLDALGDCMLRLKFLESLVLLSVSLLLIPKCILSFVNYGIVHDIVAVISSCQEARHNNVKEVNRMTHLLWGIESTLIQLLDMMVSSKASARRLLFDLNGEKIVMQRLLSEAEKAVVPSPTVSSSSSISSRSSSFPEKATCNCLQSLVLSLVALSRCFMTLGKDKEQQEKKESSGEKFIESNNERATSMSIFADCVSRLCVGYTLTCIPILTEIMDIVVEVINQDPSSVDLLNCFLQNGVIWKIWGAASRPHLPFDKDFTHNYIDLLECVCLKIDVQNIIHTMGNPFKIIFDMFVLDITSSKSRNPSVLMYQSEAILLLLTIPTFSGGIGRHMRELLHSRDNLTDLCASAAADAINIVIGILEKACVNTKGTDGVKAERYAVCITSAVLHCLDKLMTDSKFISEFTRTQKEDDNLSFIFRIVSACAHLKEYTIANFSHRNSYIDTIIPAQIRVPIFSICQKMSRQKSKFVKSVQHWSELLAYRYDVLKSTCGEGIRKDSEMPQSGSGSSKPVSHQLVESKKKRQRPNTNYTPNPGSKKKSRAFTSVSSIEVDPTMESESFSLSSLLNSDSNGVLEGAADISTADSTKFNVCATLLEICAVLEVAGHICKANAGTVSREDTTSIVSVVNSLTSLRKVVIKEIARIQLARNMREMRNNTCDDKEIEKAQLMLHLLPRSADATAEDLISIWKRANAVNIHGEVRSVMPGNSFVLVDDDAVLLQPEGTVFFHLCVGGGFIVGQEVKDKYTVDIVALNKRVGAAVANRSWENYVVSVLKLAHSSISSAVDCLRETLGQEKEIELIASDQMLELEEFFVSNDVANCVSSDLTCYFFYALLGIVDRLNISSEPWDSSYAKYYAFFNTLFDYFVTLLCHSSNEEVRSSHCANIREENMTCLLFGSEAFGSILKLLISFRKAGKETQAALSMVMHWVEKFSDELENIFASFLYIPSVLKVSIADLFFRLYYCARHYALIYDDAAAKKKVISMCEQSPHILVHLIRGEHSISYSKLFTVPCIDRIMRCGVFHSHRSKAIYATNLPEYIKSIFTRLTRCQLCVPKDKIFEKTLANIDLSNYEITNSTPSSIAPKIFVKWRQYYLIAKEILTQTAIAIAVLQPYSTLSSLRVLNTILKDGINVWSKTEPLLRNAFLVILKGDFQFRQMCATLTKNILAYAQSPTKELRECVKEILELLEIFLRPILITKPVVDCVYGLLLGQSIHGFGALDTGIKLPNLTREMSIPEMREAVRLFSSDQVPYPPILDVANLAEVLLQLISVYSSKQNQFHLEAVNILDEMNSVYILLMHIGRHVPAARVIEQHMSLLLQTSSSHLAVKRMVLPNIIVTVSETLYPTLLHEKMKHAIVTAFTQVVANRDQRWNSVNILTEIMEGNQLLASYLSPMILRQPDLFFEILREELFPERSNKDSNIFNTCCPVFYPANICMGIGPNFLKPNFEKVEEPEESRLRVSVLAATIAAELHTKLSSIETLCGICLNGELKLLSDTIGLAVDTAHILPAGHSWKFFSQLQFSSTKKSFVQWLLEDVLALLDVDAILEYKNTTRRKIQIILNEDQHHAMVASYDLYSAVLYGLLAVISLEGEPRMLLLEVLCEGMNRIVNSITSDFCLMKNRRELLYVLCISDFIRSLGSCERSFSGPNGNTQIPFSVSMKDTVALVAVSSIGELFSSISPKLMATNSKWKKTVLNSFFQAYSKLLNDGLTYANTITSYLRDLKVSPVDPEVDVHLLRVYNIFELAERYLAVQMEREKENKLAAAFSQEMFYLDDIAGDIIREITEKVFLDSLDEFFLTTKTSSPNNPKNEMVDKAEDEASSLKLPAKRPKVFSWPYKSDDDGDEDDEEKEKDSEDEETHSDMWDDDNDIDYESIIIDATRKRRKGGGGRSDKSEKSSLDSDHDHDDDDDGGFDEVDSDGDDKEVGNNHGSNSRPSFRYFRGIQNNRNRIPSRRSNDGEDEASHDDEDEDEDEEGSNVDGEEEEDEDEDEDDQQEDGDDDDDDDDESQYTVNSSDTDDDDTENNSMFGESQASFDDDNDASDSLHSEPTAYPSDPAYEVVHAFGRAVYRAEHVLDSSDLCMSSPRIWNCDPTVDKMYQLPIANLLSLSAILQEYPEEPGHGGLTAAVAAKVIHERQHQRKLHTPTQLADLLINPEILTFSLGSDIPRLYTSALWSKFDSSKPTHSLVLDSLSEYLTEKRLSWLSGGNSSKYREMLHSDCRLLHLQRSINLLYAAKIEEASWSELRSKIEFIEAILLRISAVVTIDDVLMVGFNMFLLEMVLYQLRKMIAMDTSSNPRKLKQEEKFNSTHKLFVDSKIAQDLSKTFLAVCNSYVGSMRCDMHYGYQCLLNQNKSGSQLETFPKMVLLLSKLFETVIYAFPAMAEAVMRSGGLKHPDLSGIAASYAPEIRSMHLLTPILQEVIRRDDLCDWMEDGANIRLFRNPKEKETQLPHVWQAICRTLHCFISRPENWVPILTALSEAAEYVITEVEAEVAGDIVCLNQGIGTLNVALTCHPYRRLLYYVITLSSVTSKMVQLAREPKANSESKSIFEVLLQDGGLSAGFMTMALAYSSMKLDQTEPIAQLPAEPLGPHSSNDGLGLESSAQLSLPFDASDLKQEELKPASECVDKPPKENAEDTTLGARQMSNSSSAIWGALMNMWTSMKQNTLDQDMPRVENDMLAAKNMLRNEELARIEDIRIALARALQPIRKSSCWMDLVKIIRTINTPTSSSTSSQSGSPRSYHLRDGNGIAFNRLTAGIPRYNALVSVLFQASCMQNVLFEDFKPNPIEVIEENKISDRKVDMTAPEQMIIMETPRKASPRAHLPYDGTKTPRPTDVKNSSKESDTAILSYPHDEESGSHIILEALSLFVDENSKHVNEKVKQNPRLLDFEYKSLILVPDLSKHLDLTVKRKYLKLLIARLKRPMKYSDMDELSRKVELAYARESGLFDEDDSVASDVEEEEDPESLSIHINRDQVLEQSFHALSEVSPRYLLRCTMDIAFCGEEGIDSGGLTREWYSLLTRSLFTPSYMLFTLTSDGVTYQPHPQSKVNPEHIKYFHFTGRLIAKAICDGQLMDVHFSKFVYKHILGLPISFSDLAVLDPAFHKSLSSLLNYSLNDLGLGSDGGLTFTVETTHFGKQYYEDLVPGGSQVPVTDENKQEYVRLLAHHRLVLSCKPQIDSFLRGFNEILPAATFLHFFDPSELELMISGLPEVDVEDMRANTTYSGYAPTDATIGYFWAVLRSFTAEEKALFVQFVTGSSKVPLDGFKSLKGTEGEIQRISVHKAFNVALLPTAHTCFNQLDLPEYTSEEELREKLLVAIRHGAEGFGMN